MISPTRHLTSYHAVKSRVTISGSEIPVFTGEFWTSRQRQASSLHEVSYRACFKAELPRFFIEWLTAPGDVVYDPFSGRGTTILEAALLGRRVIANDINPLSALLSAPRLHLPDPEAVAERLQSIRFRTRTTTDIDLSMFYHPQTAAELASLRRYLLRCSRTGAEDQIDRWIRMVATNRLTGHSRGFFSVYTLPPNQAVTPDRQTIINRRLKQRPEYRDVRAIILRKTLQLLREVSLDQRSALRRSSRSARILTGSAAATPEIRTGSVALTVTSPPFLDIVQYSADNWLRCWFNGIDVASVERRITMARTVSEWTSEMFDVFTELHRITAHGGWVAFEVGEVRKRKIRLEEHVAPIGMAAGFRCVAMMINAQKFTKTANIWGVRNNTHGTNSNRIVLFRKP